MTEVAVWPVLLGECANAARIDRNDQYCSNDSTTLQEPPPPQQAWGLHDIPIQQGRFGCNIRDVNMSCVEVVVQGGGVGGVRGGWNHWWGWGLVCLLCPVGLLLL